MNNFPFFKVQEQTETEVFTAQKLKPHLEAAVAYRGFETFLHEVEILR